MACVLEDDADLLLVGTLSLLAAGAEGASTVIALTAGVETADASTNAIDVTGLDPAAATSAVIVEATSEVTKGASGASTTGGWVAVTSGIGAAEFSESIAEFDEERVSMDEAPETKDCEATACLGLTAYRTAATPTLVPRSMVSICSKTILPVTPVRYDSISCHVLSSQTYFTMKSNCDTSLECSLFVF